MPRTAIQYNYLEDYLNKVRSQGRFAFTWSELKKQFDISDKALNQNLFRLKTKKKVAQIRKGFYAIVAAEYSTYGMPPPVLFIDDLMKSLNKRYYVGLLSAAALYGAAHQQPMEFFVITEKPALRNIRNKKLKISFYVKKQWSDEEIIQKKTDAGYINTSSPELTALDLLYYQESIGMNRLTTVLHELAPEMKAIDLMKTAKSYPQVAAMQRLGYLLDKELQKEKLADALWTVLKEKILFPVPLSTSKGKDGAADDKWKVIRNMNIESDI
jgi:predicted transcriptional regulator of viral defense system